MITRLVFNYDNPEQAKTFDALRPRAVRTGVVRGTGLSWLEIEVNEVQSGELPSGYLTGV